MKNRYFYIPDIDAVETVEIDSRKNLLSIVDEAIESINNGMWEDAGVISILYKDGSFEYIDEEYDGHKIRKINIVSIVWANPETYCVYGGFEVNEWGVVTASATEAIHQDIKEVSSADYTEEANDTTEGASPRTGDALNVVMKAFTRSGIPFEVKAVSVSTLAPAEYTAVIFSGDAETVRTISRRLSRYKGIGYEFRANFSAVLAWDVEEKATAQEIAAPYIERNRRFVEIMHAIKTASMSPAEISEAIALFRSDFSELSDTNKEAATLASEAPAVPVASTGKHYKGFIIDGVIFRNVADIEAYRKADALRRHKAAYECFLHSMTYAAADYAGEFAAVLVDQFGYDWDEIEALEADYAAAYPA